MNHYFYGDVGLPYHLSVGAVLVRDDGKICCHYFASTPVLHFENVRILMRETIEEGETLENAVLRGLHEEFGAKARVMDYLGSRTSYFTADAGFEVEKTTLYFLCQLVSIDTADRSMDDPESVSIIEWHEPRELIEQMKKQIFPSTRIDFDESEIIERALKIRKRSR